MRKRDNLKLEFRLFQEALNSLCILSICRTQVTAGVFVTSNGQSKIGIQR
jgi:hypothetical protein